jgi:ubiquinone/menaquinone biosynthesis C-methylase UbiE
MSDQKGEFLRAEGDRMFDRYQSAGNFDAHPVLPSLKEIGIVPKAILEIGCGAGHRLALLQKEFDAECHGIEPSPGALDYARSTYPALILEQGTAESLPYADNGFDVVIFGFCLYLCDPTDHFRIAWQADRVLTDGGYMVINDFLPPVPYSNEFSHVAGMRSYKMEFSRMFSWNPAYQLISRRYFEDNKTIFSFAPDERICTDLLRKDRAIAFPRNPYGNGQGLISR